MLIHLIIFLLLSSLLSPVELCQPEDKSTLLAFKNSFSNPNHHFQSWNSSSNCCKWSGIICKKGTQYVASLIITSHHGGLNGTLPTVLFNLRYLEFLQLERIPGLVGSIPQSIKKLTRLTSLIITRTSISGPIPNSLQNLKLLNHLDLSYNRLSGSLPPSIGKLINLRDLHMNNNRLSGSIPSSLGKLTNLRDIQLGYNQLTGTIPESFANFKLTYGIGLSHNFLSGDLPTSLARMDTASVDISRNNLSGQASMLFDTLYILYVNISKNNFEFNFSDVGFNQELVTLDISHNKIYGSIPEWITPKTSMFLRYLDVSYNRLCGKIPSELHLRGFNKTSFIHNRCLCGTPLEPCK